MDSMSSNGSLDDTIHTIIHKDNKIDKNVFGHASQLLHVSKRCHRILVVTVNKRIKNGTKQIKLN